MTEEQKKAWMFRQDETEYTSLSNSRGKACANCRWFNPYGEWHDDMQQASCHLVMSFPNPILATGMCNRHEPLPTREEIEPEPMPVIIVEPEIEVDDMERALAKPNVLKRLMKAIKEAISQPEPIGGFKALDDGKHWVAWFSNNFEDREAEILSEKAHDAYIRRLDAGLVPMPDLWFYHIPGTAHGKAIWLDRIDHMVVAVGTFDDSELAKAFQKHYAKGAKYAVSHGFKADKSKHFHNGVWSDYNTFEISPLPLEAAANPFTLFTEADMLSDEKLAALEAIIGKEKAAEIVSKSKEWSKEVESLGARYKEFTDPAKLEASQPDAAAVESVSKNIAPLLLDMQQGQLEFIEMVKGLEKSFGQKVDALNAALAAKSQEIESLKALLSLTPRRASTDGSTALTETEADKLKQQLPGNEYDSFFGDMQVPAKR